MGKVFNILESQPNLVGRRLGFYLKLEIVKETLKMEIFDPGHVEYDVD